MSEWWTYRLHDFLMFSPRAYARAVELYHEAVWPWNALAALIAFALFFVTVKLARTAPLIPAFASSAATPAPLPDWALVPAWWAYLAVVHMWLAVVFLPDHYAPIFWAANYVALLWMAQGILFAGAVFWAFRRRDLFAFTRSKRYVLASIATMSLALLGFPVIQFAISGSWHSIEVVGAAPDPTAMATLAMLGWLRPSRSTAANAQAARWLWRTLMALATVCTIFGALTRFAMNDHTAWLMLATLSISLVNLTDQGPR